MAGNIMANGCLDSAWLKMALQTAAEAAKATGQSTRGLRTTQRLAFEVSRTMWGSTTSKAASYEIIQDFEHLLSNIARVAGQAGQKFTITVAKEWLRDFGASGASLASRLGKLSKHRNMKAHPESAETLFEDIEQLAKRPPQATKAAMEYKDDTGPAAGDSNAPKEKPSPLRNPTSWVGALQPPRSGPNLLGSKCQQVAMSWVGSGHLLDAKRQQIAEEQQAKCDEFMLNATTKQTVLPVKATVQKLVAKQEESEQSKTFERDLTEKLVANCSEKDTIIASLHKEIETIRAETTMQLQAAKIASVAMIDQLSLLVRISRARRLTSRQ